MSKELARIGTALAANRKVEQIESMAHPKIDFSQVSAEERIQLAEDIWDSLASLRDSVPVPDAHAREIDRRLAAYRQDEDRGQPWRPVLDRIEADLPKRGA